MVALKLVIVPVASITPVAKQERRGGIETFRYWLVNSPNDRRSRNAVVALKPGMIALMVIGAAGSRNAVVALKRHLRRALAHHNDQKQERRGGIETLDPGAQGTIEAQEAGTPWWH